MTTYNGFIRFDGFDRRWNDPRIYQTAMLDLTHKISRTDTGRCVLHEIKMSGFELLVKPSQTMYEGEANPGNEHPWRAKDQQSNCALPAKSTLRFLPGHYDPKAQVFVETDPYFRAADNYIHELFHKARMMQGSYCKDKTDDGYDDMEEFFAILVANVYVSEVAADYRLRGSHAALFQPLKLTSYDFWMKYDQRLSKLAGQMSDFCKRIAKINAKFNPYREYYKHISEGRAAHWPAFGT